MGHGAPQSGRCEDDGPEVCTEALRAAAAGVVKAEARATTAARGGGGGGGGEARALGPSRSDGKGGEGLLQRTR